MSYQTIDGQLFINSDVMDTTSTKDRCLSLNGDTFRISSNRTIAEADSNGYKGEICWDSNYIYVCVADNTWKRVAIANTLWL